MSETLEMHPELGREVEVGSIDRELRKLWSEDEARTNASLINLAVYSEHPGALVENSRIMQELTREHACRALLVGIDRAAEQTSIRAWITAHCHLAHGRKSVCSEQIAFALTGRATGRLRNTVFAHLNSDLPLVVWWQGELSPIFSERFHGLVDRFVFDSAEWADPRESFARIGEAMEQSRQMIIHDLAWSRSHQLRVSLAALFDDPVAQAALPSIDRVEITHQPGQRTAALQLLAWLVVQAGWRDGLELDLALAGGARESEGFSFENQGGVPVLATLRVDPEGAPVGSLRLKGGEVRVEVRQEAGARFLSRRLEAPGHAMEAPGPVDPVDPAALLGEQLSRSGRNRLLRKILPRFIRLLGDPREA